MLESFGPRTVGPIRTLAAGCIFPPQRCRKTLTARDRQTVTTRQTYGPRPMLHATARNQRDKILADHATKTRGNGTLQSDILRFWVIIAWECGKHLLSSGVKCRGNRAGIYRERVGNYSVGTWLTSIVVRNPEKLGSHTGSK